MDARMRKSRFGAGPAVRPVRRQRRQHPFHRVRIMQIDRMKIDPNPA